MEEARNDNDRRAVDDGRRDRRVAIAVLGNDHLRGWISRIRWVLRRHVRCHRWRRGHDVKRSGPLDFCGAPSVCCSNRRRSLLAWRGMRSALGIIGMRFEAMVAELATTISPVSMETALAMTSVKPLVNLV